MLNKMPLPSAITISKPATNTFEGKSSMLLLLISHLLTLPAGSMAAFLKLIIASFSRLYITWLKNNKCRALTWSSVIMPSRKFYFASLGVQLEG